MQVIVHTNQMFQLNLEAKLKPNLQAKTPTNQIEGITRNYRPSKNPFEIIKEEPPKLAKANPTPKAETKANPTSSNSELNIKPEEPSTLDKFRNKLNELREKLMGEKPTNPAFEIPCLASNQIDPNNKPFDVVLGLVEMAEAKSGCTYKVNGKEVTKENVENIRKQGGNFEIEIDKSNKGLELREDYVAKTYDQAINRVAEELNLKNVDLRKLKWDLEQSNKSLQIGKYEFIPVDDSTGVAYKIKNLETNREIAIIRNHYKGHSGFAETDKNSSLPHINIEIYSTNNSLFKGKYTEFKSHIVYGTK